jgi:hypothetical protein
MQTCFLSNFAISMGHGGGTTVARILGDDCARFDLCISYGGWGRHGRALESVRRKTSQIDFPLDRIPHRTPLRQFRQWLRVLPSVSEWEHRSVLKQFRKKLGTRTMRMLVCPQDQLSVRLVDWASRWDSAEYITWVMDDHELKDHGGFLSYDESFEPLWERHLQRAHSVFVISEAMKSFYAERFGVESVVLHGAVPRSTMAATVACRASGPLRLGYAGSVFGWQEDPLRLLAESAASGLADLHYAGSARPTWLQGTNVHYHGTLTGDETLTMLRACDATVLPMSFLPEYASLSRLNVATKLSELCAIGVPILAVGPADAAMIVELSSRKAAICVTSATLQAVQDGLAQLANATSALERSTNARLWFEREINLEEMQKRWSPAGAWLFGKSPSKSSQ